MSTVRRSRRGVLTPVARGAARSAPTAPIPTAAITSIRARGAFRALCVAAVAVLLGLWAAAPASAHDALVSADPADGAAVAAAPDAVTLTFDAPALGIGTTLRVIGPGGDVQSGPPRLVDDTVTQDLAPGIPAGRYRIAWRVSSADGHPVSGELSFTASAPNPRAPSTPSPTAEGATGAPTAAVAGSGGSSSTWIWVVLGVVVVLVGGGLVVSRRGAGRR